MEITKEEIEVYKPTGDIYLYLLLNGYSILSNDSSYISNRILLDCQDCTIAEVNLDDIKTYLTLNHTTYNIYIQRLELYKKSKLASRQAKIPETERVLENIINLYSIKYLYNKINLK